MNQLAVTVDALNKRFVKQIVFYGVMGVDPQ